MRDIFYLIFIVLTVVNATKFFWNYHNFKQSGSTDIPKSLKKDLFWLLLEIAMIVSYFLT